MYTLNWGYTQTFKEFNEKSDFIQTLYKLIISTKLTMKELWNFNQSLAELLIVTDYINVHTQISLILIE